jgi:outer membrane protein TolC
LESPSEAKSLGLQAEAHDKKATQTAMELRTRFETSKQELKLTHDLLHSAEKGVEQGNQYLSRTMSEYARGVKNSPDVLGASQKVIDLKRRLAELRKDYHTARAELMATLGR